MRNNVPVTNVVYILADGETVVSKTDLQGNITYINQDFINISGFSAEWGDAGARLADETGTTMGKIVASVRQVAGYMAGIAAASHEQGQGIDDEKSGGEPGATGRFIPAGCLMQAMQHAP